MEPQLNQEVINTAAEHDGPIETDAVIIGAGPVGLFQVFELGLLEIKAHIIDSLAYPGGQPIELYPDKPIYDIPAIPVCTGKELTDNLMKQIEPFGPTFHLGQEVSVVEKREDGRFFIETSKGTQFLTKTIFIAAGVGAFQPKLLRVDGLEQFDNSQLFYRVKNPADITCNSPVWQACNSAPWGVLVPISTWRKPLAAATFSNTEVQLACVTSWISVCTASSAARKRAVRSATSSSR